MAVVYRVETPEGFGPYSKIAPKFPSHENHRSPGSENLEFPFYWSFGFRDLSKLTLWFSGDEIKALGEYGQSWLLSKYEVSENLLRTSPNQVAFHRERAELLGCIPLETLAGAERSELPAGAVADLEQSFVAHEDCKPLPAIGLFRSSRTVFLQEELLRHGVRRVVESLEDGRYYWSSRDGQSFLYRSGELYPLRVADFQPLSVDRVLNSLESIRPFGA